MLDGLEELLTFLKTMLHSDVHTYVIDPTYGAPHGRLVTIGSLVKSIEKTVQDWPREDRNTGE